LAQGQRPSRFAQLWNGFRSLIPNRLQLPKSRAIYPKAQTQEMQPCVDA
jgi:hypothetical protein